MDSLMRDLREQRDQFYKESLGQQYPEFSTLSLNGDEITHEMLTGKVTMINFWFESCTPCVAEFDALIDLYQRYKDNPAFQFISFTSDPLSYAEKSVPKFQLPYIVCPIPREECTRLKCYGFPTNIVVDQEGKIAYIKSGGPRDKEEAFRHIKQFEDVIIGLLDSK